MYKEWERWRDHSELGITRAQNEQKLPEELARAGDRTRRNLKAPPQKKADHLPGSEQEQRPGTPAIGSQA